MSVPSRRTRQGAPVRIISTRAPRTKPRSASRLALTPLAPTWQMVPWSPRTRPRSGTTPFIRIPAWQPEKPVPARETENQSQFRQPYSVRFRSSCPAVHAVDGRLQAGLCLRFRCVVQLFQSGINSRFDIRRVGRSRRYRSGNARLRRSRRLTSARRGSGCADDRENGEPARTVAGWCLRNYRRASEWSLRPPGDSSRVRNEGRSRID